MLSSRSLLPPVMCIIAQYWSFSRKNASYKKSEIISYFHVSSRFSLKTKQFKPLLGLGFYPKKGHCWWREGRGRHLGQLLQSGESFRKICLESSERFIVVEVEVAAAKLFAAGIMGMNRLGGFFSEHVFFFWKQHVMLLPRCGEVFGVSVSWFHSFLLLIW